MKNLRFVLWLLCTFLCLVTAVHAQNDTAAIHNCFTCYKSAILNDRGEEAVRYVDSHTLRYYSMMLELTLHADSTTLSVHSFLDKLMVLAVRHRTTREQLQQMDGTALLIYAINSGMVGKGTIARNDIGSVAIDGSVATGQLVSDGKQTPLSFSFYREDGQWKLDLTALFPVAETAMQQMVKGSGTTEDEYVLTLLEMMTGEKPAASIWEPLD